MSLLLPRQLCGGSIQEAIAILVGQAFHPVRFTALSSAVFQSFESRDSNPVNRPVLRKQLLRKLDSVDKLPFIRANSCCRENSRQNAGPKIASSHEGQYPGGFTAHITLGHFDSMQSCGYCGKQNDAHMTHCAGCGTALAPENVGSFADVAGWSPTSPSGRAIATGLGAFLVSTAVYFAIGRLTLDCFRMFAGGDADSIFYRQVVMFRPVFMSPLLAMAGVAFIWFAAYRRRQARLHAFSGALLASAILVVVLFGPRFSPDLLALLWLLPVTLIGIGTGASVGYYFGAASQILIGAWLLGWFRQRECHDDVSKA